MFLKARNVVILLKARNEVRAVTYVQNIDNVSQGQKCSQSCYLCPERW